MKYSDLLMKLQRENEGKIVLMKNGIFFVAIGKDAVALNDLLGLKLTCMKNKLCKAGFQVKSFEKYIRKLKDTNKSFIMYTYDNSTGKEDKIFEYIGDKVTETRQCLDCNNCGKKTLDENEIIEKIKNMK